MRKTPAVAALVLVLVAVLGAFAISRALSHNGIKIPLVIGPECTVRGNTDVTLDSVQMANAATISAVGMRRGMPERAVTIALATALQESKLENLEEGDRDSVGLFQQRPSQGWGTTDEIKDPRYAANKFYATLKRVKGWQQMRITDAAQKVQRSAYPNAYAKWEDEASVLASALTGRETAAVACTVSDTPVLRGAAATAALTEGLKLDWGAGLDKTQLAEQTAGLTLGVTDSSTGWQYAHWLVSHASGTGLEWVRFADLEWHAPDGKWQPVTGDNGIDQRKVIAQVFR